MSGPYGRKRRLITAADARPSRPMRGLTHPEPVTYFLRVDGTVVAVKDAPRNVAADLERLGLKGARILTRTERRELVGVDQWRTGARSVRTVGGAQ